MLTAIKIGGNTLLMTTNEITALDRAVARKEQLIRELASDLADLVASGDLADVEANEILVAKQDQYFAGDR